MSNKLPPGETPQKRGRSWEEIFAKDIGGKPVKMSGAGFAKLDVRGSSLLWSLKYTETGSVRLSNTLMQEALDAINGPGGIGGGGEAIIPGIAFSIDGEEYICLRKDDAMMLMTSDEISIAAPKKGHNINREKYKSPLQRAMEEGHEHDES